MFSYCYIGDGTVGNGTPGLQGVGTGGYHRLHPFAPRYLGHLFCYIKNQGCVKILSVSFTFVLDNILIGGIITYL